MRPVARLIPILAIAMTGLAVSAEETSAVNVTRLTDHLLMMSTDHGSYTTNSLVSVGDDGILLVDTQAAEDAPALKQVIDGLGRGAPRFIVNTHRHGEHIGGNTLFGPEPVIIGHDLMRTELRSGAALFDEVPDQALPTITFSDRISLTFNGEEVRLIGMPGSHDNNEIIVLFTGSKVVHLSSLVNGFNFPSVDSDGDVLKFANLVERALKILPHDVRIVSGHNRVGTYDDLVAYHDMLVRTTDIVRRGLESGKDAAALKREGALDAWKAYAGSYVSVDRWIDELVEGFQPKQNKPRVFEPLYHAMQRNGARGAVELYRVLRRDHGDEFTFKEADLLAIGDKLLNHGKTEQAIPFLELELEMYPDGSYVWYTTLDLARAHAGLGDREEALRLCRRAAELNPDSEAIASFLRQLEAGD